MNTRNKSMEQCQWKPRLLLPQAHWIHTHKQSWHSTYSVKLWRVRLTIVAMEKQHASLCIIVDLQIALSDIKLLRVVIETQEWVSFAHLLSYRIFRIADNINVRLCVKYPKFLLDLAKFGVSGQIFKVYCTEFHDYPSS
jgi:hypothetical protein